MKHIFENEPVDDPELVRYHKTSLQNKLNYDDKGLYAADLMRRFKAFEGSYRWMAIYSFLAYVVVGLIIPYQLITLIEDRQLAGLLGFGCFGVAIVYSIFNKNTKEPVHLLKCKIQAHKELLREVSQYWYKT
jgi:hypothetical protein